MKNLKFVFFSLLASITLTVFMTSCEQETITPETVGVPVIPADIREYVENLDPEMMTTLESIPERTPENTANPNISDRGDCYEYDRWDYSPDLGWYLTLGNDLIYGSPALQVYLQKYDVYAVVGKTDLCNASGTSFFLPPIYNYSELRFKDQYLCGGTGWFWDDDETDNSVRSFTDNGIQDVYCEGGGFDIEWADKTGVYEGEDINTLGRSLHSGWDCNSGAASLNTIPANVDGWVEMTVAENWSTKFFGLSNSNSDACRWTIDYSVYFNGHQLRIYESGQNKIYAANCVVGDAVRVERIGSTIYYKKNGATIYTSHKPSYGALIADVSIKDRNGMIGHSRCSRR